MRSDLQVRRRRVLRLLKRWDDGSANRAGGRWRRGGRSVNDPAGIPAVVDAVSHMHDRGAKHVETAFSA